MTSVAICTSVYPVEPTFASAFSQGIAAASRRAGKVTLLLAVENRADCSAILNGLPASAEVRQTAAPEGVTPAGLRRHMVQAAVGLPADMIVFCDLDDCLRPEALDEHRAALADAEISYGDMVLVDRESHPLGRTFFEGAEVPSALGDATPLLERNFMGFTNTAIRRDALSEEACRIPDAVVAADWWFFTMHLAEGRRARRTKNPVVDYRQYGENVIGAGSCASAAQFGRRAAIMLDHYMRLPDWPGVEQKRVELRRLIAAIEDRSDFVRFHLDSEPNEAGVWFDDVRRALSMLNAWSASRTAAGALH